MLKLTCVGTTFLQQLRLLVVFPSRALWRHRMTCSGPAVILANSQMMLTTAGPYLGVWQEFRPLEVRAPSGRLCHSQVHLFLLLQVARQTPQ